MTAMLAEAKEILSKLPDKRLSSAVYYPRFLNEHEPNKHRSILNEVVDVLHSFIKI